ncbi:U3 small nucleolar RNA-associated protein 4 homolog isoform X2 [Cimex lectularius]|nr:U3 small nucleolar RNA-associated protein 4 homolog isoform X2 [Cimex lectularius]
MHPLTSGSSWCIGICKENKKLAAGTEDGFINIFDLSDELIYNKLLDKQEGRIICLVWDKKGEHIITGSVDTVRIWNVSTGHAIQRMVTGRAMNNKETIVWSVAITEDFTVISGDSRGKLCFWDGNTGISITSYQSHKADVLSLCLSKDENTVYCAGVDPLIASYERVKVRDSDERGKWVKSIQRVIHDHDVKCLVICDDKLFSAGVDGYLAMSSYPPKFLVKYPPLLQPPAVCIAPKSRSMLLRYPTSLLIWKFENPNPVKMLEWKTSNEAKIKCASLSSDGAWLACSSLGRFRLFNIKYESNVARLNRVKVQTKKNLMSNCLAFSDDSMKLAVATVEAHIHIVGLSTTNILESYYPLKEKSFTSTVGFILFSPDGDFLVAADLHSNILVWKEGKVHAKLPRYACSITALAIQPETDLLVAVYADHKLVEYSLHKKKYTGFSRKLQDQHPKQWLSRNFPVHSIAFDPKNKDIIMLNDDSTILIINKQKEIPKTEAKIPRLSSGGSDVSTDILENSNQHPLNNSPKQAFHVIKKYKHLVFFGMLGEDEMIAVEISPVTLKEKLPTNFKQKRFGRM